MKKILISTSLFIILSNNLMADEKVILPDSFYKLSPEIQKEILLDKTKLDSYLKNFGLENTKTEIIIDKKPEEKKETSIEVKKISNFKSAENLSKSELISKGFLFDRYDSNLEFEIIDSKKENSKVYIGKNNGYKVNPDNKIKFDISDAKMKFPVGEYFIEDFSNSIEEGEIKVFQVEIKNALEYKSFSTEHKIGYLVIGYIDGELYLDLNANKDTLKVKIDSDKVRIKDDKNLISNAGNLLNLSEAKIVIKKR